MSSPKYKDRFLVLLSKSVLTDVRGTRTRYERDLKSKQSDGKSAEKTKLDEDINVAAAKIKRLTDEVKQLISVADTKAKEAELNSLKSMIESNDLRDSAKRKESEIVSAKEKLEKLKTTM